MRNRELHDSLRAFALEAAAMLRDEQAAGAEIEFDLEDGGARGGPSLYHYRPLTQKFIAQRWTRLRFLPSAGRAADALDAGAEAYLRLNGLRGAEPEPALRAMLERLYEDSSDLAFPEERFERVYSEVERTLYEKSQSATVLVPVHGLEMEVERIELGDGLCLTRGDCTDAPDEAVWGDPADPTDPRCPDRAPNALLVLERDVAPDHPLPLAEARDGFGRVLRGLRLFKSGGVSLAAVAWRRTGGPRLRGADGLWQPFELEATGDARGAPWVMLQGEEAELAQFLVAAGEPPRGGSLAWALSRFHMGCGRRQESEALTDYLLALRALIDDGESGMALRVAVLCAQESERRRVQRRLELAQALERFVIGDGADDAYLEAVGPDSPRTLVEEVERHLRALLRDLLCGYLDTDLRRVADELLLDQPEPFEIRAATLRQPPAAASTARVQQPPGEPAARPVREEPARRFVQEDDPAEHQAGLDEPGYWSAPV